ncbi:MAG: biopolymer transporter ExbD [Chloroherpetonaceae bacterium]|nr:biopolymer transporter ExbD [Chloroherpetonaceae bacterium]
MNFFGFFMHGGDDAIDLAPLVDIAFLLLTFFMMTTVFNANEELKPELPESSGKEKEPGSNYISVVLVDSTKGDRIIVNMDDSQVRVDAMQGRLSRNEALKTTGFEIKNLKQDPELKDLYEVLLRARQAKSTQVVVLKADKNCKYESINKVLLTMKKVRFDKVKLITVMEK